MILFDFLQGEPPLNKPHEKPLLSNNLPGMSTCRGEGVGAGKSGGVGSHGAPEDVLDNSSNQGCP